MYSLVNLDIVGYGTHRSGWPYTRAALRRSSAPNAPFLLDDYVERTFLFKRCSHLNISYTTPWIGICHHPPNVPGWYSRQGLENLGENPRWQDSIESLRFVVALGENAARWIRTKWQKPCITLRHPTAVPRHKWSAMKFENNSDKCVIQVGSFLRNTCAIYQLRVPGQFRKVRLVQQAEWISLAHEKCRKVYRHRGDVGEVEEIPQLSNDAYDDMLSKNVVFLELIAAVANNTVIECIARNTPILLNRLAGPEFYLGRDYPLFYDEIEEAERLLSNENILRAHNYLRSLDKRWLSRNFFIRTLLRTCSELVSVT